MYLAERGPESRSQSSETEQKPDSQEPHLRKGRGGAGLSPDQVPTILSSWAPSMNTNKNGFCMRKTGLTSQLCIYFSTGYYFYCF